MIKKDIINLFKSVKYKKIKKKIIFEKKNNKKI